MAGDAVIGTMAEKAVVDLRRAIELPEAVKSKFLPAADYARAKSVDWSKMESVQNAFTERYLAEVR